MSVHTPFTNAEQQRNLGRVPSAGMVTPAPVTLFASAPTPLGTVAVGVQERAVLAVLLSNRGRVVSRRELSRQAGLGALSERRCDGVIVALRRRLGADSVITVRSRGWMLAPTAETAASTLL